MRKSSNTETPVIENNQVDTPAPAVEMETLPPIAPATKNTQVNFNFTDEAAQEEDMNPVRDILSAGMQDSEEFSPEMVLLTVDEVAAFLKGTYQLQGWFTYPELWVRDSSFFYEIAAGILPNINAWAARVPAVAHAVKTVSAAGSWGKLIWDMAGTWVLIVRRRQLEAEKKKEEEENKNGGYKIDYTTQQQQQQQPAPSNAGTKHSFIIP